MTEEKKWGHPDFYVLLDTIADLHSRKNHDYAGEKDPLANFKAVERMGFTAFDGAIVRMCDKWTRIENFIKSKNLQVKDETIEDTLMDLAVYSLIAILLKREQK
jgi:hypothetical protein